MTRSTTTRSLTLAAISLLSAAAGAAADYMPGQDMFLSGQFRLPDNRILAWGLPTDARPTFGSTSMVPIRDVANGNTIVGQMRISSGSLPPPPGKKFAGTIGLEPTGEVRNMIGGAVADVHLEDIKNGITNIVNGARAFGPLGEVPQAQIMIDPAGTSIWVRDVPGTEFLIAPFVTLNWTQRAVPAPGSLALLGLAGMTAVRRRAR